MYLKQAVLAGALATPLVLIAPWASAGDEHHHDQDAGHRQYGVHVHGIAALNLALEASELQIEIDSPAANIVGFEHAPSSAGDHAALDEAVALLEDGDRLFKFSDDAGCHMKSANVATEFLDDQHEHGGHAGDKAGEHAHEETQEHRDEGHADEHGHEGGTHSDIMAVYDFKCDAPDKLTALAVELFDAFPGMQKVKVQYAIESKQGAAELTAAERVVEF
jgi:hypothetical protein